MTEQFALINPRNGLCVSSFGFNMPFARRDPLRVATFVSVPGKPGLDFTYCEKGIYHPAQFGMSLHELDTFANENGLQVVELVNGKPGRTVNRVIRLPHKGALTLATETELEACGDYLVVFEPLPAVYTVQGKSSRSPLMMAGFTLKFTEEKAKEIADAMGDGFKPVRFE